MTTNEARRQTRPGGPRSTLPHRRPGGPPQPSATDASNDHGPDPHPGFLDWTGDLRQFPILHDPDWMTSDEPELAPTDDSDLARSHRMLADMNRAIHEAG